MQPEGTPRLFWGLQAFRMLSMRDNQVRSLRKQGIVDLFQLRQGLENYMAAKPLDEEVVRRVSRKGAYWGAFTDLRDYMLEDRALDCPFEKTQELARLPTRLWAVSKASQECLINWGYAVCDAAMCKYVEVKLAHNAQFPLPGGVG
jgi:NTE family protein